MDADPTPSAGARLERLLGVLRQGLGHDLANQLVAVRGLASLLETDEAERLSADGRDYLKRLSAAAVRAHALVADLADVARLGRQELAGTADLADAAAEAVASVRATAPRRPVEYQGPGQPLLLAVSASALARVLFLLLRRAVGPPADDRPLHVAVSARVAAGRAEVRVTDDAPALPAEFLGRLFEPFGPAGEGFDLFVARWLVEGWGGTVRAESEPGRGNVFILTCPLSPVPGPSLNAGDKGQGTRDKGQGTRP
jgi:signal transduction histidine kinase